MNVAGCILAPDLVRFHTFSPAKANICRGQLNYVIAARYGWRAMFAVGGLPALLVAWIRGNEAFNFCGGTGNHEMNSIGISGNSAVTDL